MKIKMRIKTIIYQLRDSKNRSVLLIGCLVLLTALATTGMMLPNLAILFLVCVFLYACFLIAGKIYRLLSYRAKSIESQKRISEGITTIL
jgi:hypothetical protein